jgi:hypothetical protein
MILWDSMAGRLCKTFKAPQCGSLKTKLESSAYPGKKESEDISPDEKKEIRELVSMIKKEAR